MASDATPEPAMSSRAALVDFFSRSLTAFQSSRDAFRVVCTLSRRRGHDDTTAATTTTTPVPQPPRRRVSSLVVLDSSFNPPTLAHLRMAVSAVRDLRRSGHGDAGSREEASAVRLLLLLAVNNADKKPQPAAFPVRLGMMHAFAQDLLDELRAAAPSLAKGDGEPQEEEDNEMEVDLGLTMMPYFHDKSQAISDAGFYAVDGEGPEQVYLAGYDTLVRIFNPKYYNASAALPSPSGSGDVDGGVAPIRRALDPFLERSRLRITMRADDEWGSEADQVAHLERLRNGGLEEVGGRTAWAERVEMVRGLGEVVSSTRVRRAAKERDEEALGRLVGARVKEWVLGEGLYHEE
ncbi:cytidylyltransferase [Colletotrichum graminicola]|uniref:Cytidylyltransferase n=1 Tax=Colletotrichum graminicola (strain M1.001 / M2 / FGSC 10212) TaxID=645133 RepID=E3QW63_COLGM|nr:cytidylyltransferase [Colletotrichum graminicola M1.001]EFQ35097.1 cytidylyltransferase [Colletotrichum graminicola M1.001]WDK10515.1 cytidylyltransferase [Colletotrichum graminicola]